MKSKEKQLARNLRKKGWSINEIYRELGVGKASVSIWVRDIQLTQAQRQNLSEKGISKDVIEKRRTTRLTKENARRQVIIDKAKLDITSVSRYDLFIIGIALYWAEGSKTKRGVVEFSNGDPRLIQLMMQFFNTICKVPKGKFRGHIHIHSHLPTKRAETYWSNISRIPLAQFYKTYNKPNKASKNKKDSLPFGTFAISICDTELFLKIQGWMEKLYELSVIKTK